MRKPLMDMSVYGDRVHRRRLDLGLSRKDVVEKAGVSINALQKLESGENVRAVTYMAVCRVLDLKIEFYAA